ncbi:MAG: hypothetical protein LC799_28315 [Actinobacteria bacterium]|nr:hypothetical protein [Actinomycetota bacterium]
MLVSVGCAEEPVEEADAQSDLCGAPTPDPRADSSLVPDAFLPGGATVVDAKRTGKTLNASVLVSFDVQEALTFYKRAFKTEGYEVITEDNEGFEAELYTKRRQELAGLKVRSTLCNQVTLINIVLQPSLNR